MHHIALSENLSPRELLVESIKAFEICQNVIQGMQGTYKFNKDLASEWQSIPERITCQKDFDKLTETVN